MLMHNTVVFDYDGVIVDSLDFFIKYFVNACKNEGIDSIATKNKFLSLFEGNMYESMHKRGLSDEQILKVIYILKDGLLKDQANIKMYPGIHEVIKKLSNNNFLFVITSNDSQVVEEYLNSRNLNNFTEIFGSDKDPSKLNNLEFIKKNYKSDNIYYICDTVGDIVAARKANVLSISVSWGWHDKNLLLKHSPDFLISSPLDLLNIIS
jgi:phosphoglycolate phosphatase